MIEAVAIVALAAGAPSFAGRLDSLGHAPPSLVLRLQQPIVGRGWMRVSTRTSRFDVRVGRLDATGLGALTPRDPGAAPLDPVPWSRISRIDQVRTRKLRGTLLGAGAGLVVSSVTVRVAGASHESDNSFLLVPGGMLVGGVTGYLLGSKHESEYTLYAAEPAGERTLAILPSPPSTPVPDSAAASPRLRFSSFAPRPPATVSAGVTAADRIDRAGRKIGPGRLLRISGAGLGTETGHAVRADPGGLHGFRPSGTQTTGRDFPDVLPWISISRIEIRGNQAGRGALVTGLMLGGLGALTGMAVTGALGGTDSEVWGGAAIGFGVVGPIGAGLGAAFGALIPCWKVVY